MMSETIVRQIEQIGYSL